MNDQTPTTPIDPAEPEPSAEKDDGSTKATLTGLIAGVAITAIGFMMFSEDPEPVTPEVCVAALDTAEDAFAVSGKGFTLVGELIDAVVAFDVDTVERVAVDFEGVATDLTPLTTEYRRDAAKCRASL